MLVSSTRHRLLPTAAFRFQSRTVSQARTGGIQDPTAYCRDLVRKHDNDAYLCSYFYPRHLQGAYFALRAFNVSYFKPGCIMNCFSHSTFILVKVELATVKENVSRTMIGQMRMQFWKDAVKGISEVRLSCSFRKLSLGFILSP